MHAASGELETIATTVGKLPDLGWGTRGNQHLWFVDVLDLDQVADLPTERPDDPLGRFAAWLRAGYRLDLADGPTKVKRDTHVGAVKNAVSNPFAGQKLSAGAARDAQAFNPDGAPGTIRDAGTAVSVDLTAKKRESRGEGVGTDPVSPGQPPAPVLLIDPCEGSMIRKELPMPGPLPSRNGPQKKGPRSVKQWATLPREHDVTTPELPKRDLPWDARTVQFWLDLWASPMAAQYDDSDRHGLFMLADLVDSYWRVDWVRDKIALAAEIRLQGQRFGLSALDRQRLRWELERADEAQDRGRCRRARTLTPVDPDDDPRNLLGKL
ncbi:phage terminase small subunit [Saccharopolyspora pogona]|uniref:phage terminase small subunit n=1 Tax=Saccharopolyspora pogona TaxID=333966 RepID=UPI001682F6D2|nr:hypothetical protein [Saccharopolyspora pogona]